jgi:YidC/Oxa1 family membrane protein insertase
MFISLFADPMRALIFAAAHLFGGSLGGGIFAVSLAARLVFMPLTLRLARRARERQRAMNRLQPELARIKKQFAKQPDKLAEAVHAAHRREGIEIVDRQELLGGLARLPVLGGIYGALRSIPRLGSFAWIPDLAKPNLPLALIVTVGSAISTYIASHGGATRTLAVSAIVGSAISLAFLLHMSSAIALSWGASVAGDVVQNVVLLRRASKGRATGALTSFLGRLREPVEHGDEVVRHPLAHRREEEGERAGDRDALRDPASLPVRLDVAGEGERRERRTTHGELEPAPVVDVGERHAVPGAAIRHHPRGGAVGEWAVHRAVADAGVPLVPVVRIAPDAPDTCRRRGGRARLAVGPHRAPPWSVSKRRIKDTPR